MGKDEKNITGERVISKKIATKNTGKDKKEKELIKIITGECGKELQPNMVSIGIGSTVAAPTHLPTFPDQEKGKKNKQTLAFALTSQWSDIAQYFIT